MAEEHMFGFSWSFIDEVSWWSLGIAFVIAAAVFLATGDTAFVVGCLGGAAVDIGLVRLSSHRAKRELADGRIDGVAPMVMVAGRLFVKTGLLLIAIFFPMIMSLAGTITGVLVFDVTLAVVGSVLAASRTMRRPKEGG